jgi:4-hydroxythreonine-4-phosphate dehydrogenase
MKKIAISIGDLNGIGIQLALENHQQISKIVTPIYCIDRLMLKQASQLLGLPIPKDFHTHEDIAPLFEITPSTITKESGAYSFLSFKTAVDLAKTEKVDGIMTLPIHKKAWEIADVHYKGHTDALRDFFDAPAIMMLGCPQMFVALYTEHIPLHQIPKEIHDVERLSAFLIDFYHAIHPKKEETIALLGLNPHAGDGGVLGDEEQYIIKARTIAHKQIGHMVYTTPLVPDVAFTPNSRQKYRYFVAMYHDQGLAPLKALYFDEGINISLNLPIKRASVDHGTAFDIAYQQTKLNNLSYLNAIEYLSNKIFS